MKKASKAIAFAMASAMAVSMAACGGSASSTASGAASGDSASATGNGSYDQITYAYATFNNIPTEEDLDVVEEEINKITREKIGAEITLKPISIADYVNKVSLSLQGGEKIDVYQSLGNFGNCVSTDMCYDISDLIDSCAPETKALLGDKFLDACKVNGKLYGIPTYKPFALTPMFIYSLMKGPFKSDWCGFDNFEFLFKTKDAWIMTRNTLLYNTAFIIIGTVAAILVAILMCELGEKKRVKFYQAVMLLPNLLSWVVIGFIAYAFLNADTGFINNTFLRWLGLDPVAWYSTSGAWPIILVIVNLWKNVGYQSIIFMAAISGIDKSLFEAAAIDGASKLRQIRSITLPLLKPTIITLTLMSVGRIFYSDFGLFYQVPQNSGAIFATTQTIDTYVYRGLMELNNVGMSAAAGLYQSIVGFVLVLIANQIVRKFDADNALF